MQKNRLSPRENGRTFAMAMMFESGLGFVGILVAWLTGCSLAARLMISQWALLRGLLACVPMLAMLWVLMRSAWPPLLRLRRQVEEVVQELFGQSKWWELAMISLAAGLGEELLFRGALQPWVASWTTPVVALVVVSMLFGLAHALSTTYFLLATVIGGYFGLLTMVFDDLVAPIVAHTVYDFVALMVVKRLVRDQQ